MLFHAASILDNVDKIHAISALQCLFRVAGGGGGDIRGDGGRSNSRAHAARAAQLEGERYLRLLLRSTIEHSPPLPVVRAVALASDPPKRTNSVRSLTVKERMSVPGAISARRLIEEA